MVYVHIKRENSRFLSYAGKDKNFYPRVKFRCSLSGVQEKSVLKELSLLKVYTFSWNHLEVWCASYKYLFVCGGFTAQSTQWGHVECYQFTLPHFYWVGLVL